MGGHRTHRLIVDHQHTLTRTHRELRVRRKAELAHEKNVQGRFEGAGHLGGKDSVQDLLAKRGIKSERVAAE